MLFIALLSAVLIMYIIQYKLYGKHALDDIEYSISLSMDEVFEDEDVYIYEDIVNNKYLPVPFIKVETELPKGLVFRIQERDKRTGKVVEKFPKSIQSIFVLPPKKHIRRRWRLKCTTRGDYTIGKVRLVSNDLIGYNAVSNTIELPRTKGNQLTVLPKAVELSKHFTSSKYHTGDIITQRSLLTDPLLRCGTREYTSSDPMNKINWLSTAAHGKLMVNVEEYTQRHLFNIVMNMNSRDIEKDAAVSSIEQNIELCITVAASILDSVSADNVPVRFICNTPPENTDESMRASDDEIGSKILMTPTYQGKRDMIEALRLLATLKPEISCPIDKMMDYILAYPEYFSSGGNIVFVSSYLSERMLVFNTAMKKRGIHVIFYITTTNNNAIIIPDDVEIHFKTYL